MPLFRFSALLLLACWLCGCSSEPERARPIGEAFAGPVTMNLRSDLGTRSTVVGMARHGERLEVLRNRRRFYKVRTASGQEGWVDGRNLLTSEQMRELRRLAEEAARLPSMGRATVYDPLNIHTDPNRQSPTIHQVPAGGAVEVLGHRVAPRVPFQPVGTILPPPPPAPSRKPARRKKETESPLVLPMPKAPAPPPDWAAGAHPPAALSTAPPPPEPPKPVPKDDWSLVRTQDGKAGWVLTRMLTMAIPDEVAQYAEGHRITAYLALGEVNDDGKAKRHYVWTTLSTTLQPYEFDSFRVFIYNVRRHRYETAYIERNLTGYYPLTGGTVQVTEGRKSLTVPSFTVLVEDGDGKLWRQTYSFQLYRVRLVDKQPASRPGNMLQSVGPGPGPAPGPSLANEMKEKVKGLLGR